MTLEKERKIWNQRQKELRQTLLSPEQYNYNQVLVLFLHQHAALHTAALIPDDAPDRGYSLADAVLSDMSEAQIRRIPHNCEHSVAWCLWHMARIEDVTMNVLVNGRSQILHQNNWLDRMQVTVQGTGNYMSPAEVADLSANIHIDPLQAYRLAVGRQTRAIVSSLTVEMLKQPVAPARLQQIVAQGAVPAESSLLRYWGKRTIAELLLMPPTRHNFVHLNEALRLKSRRK